MNMLIEWKKGCIINLAAVARVTRKPDGETGAIVTEIVWNYGDGEVSTHYGEAGTQLWETLSLLALDVSEAYAIAGTQR